MTAMLVSSLGSLSADMDASAAFRVAARWEYAIIAAR